jgi:hypothetical protein
MLLGFIAWNLTSYMVFSEIRILAVVKIGPRRPMTRKRLVGAPWTNFFSLGQKTVFGMGGD